MASIVEIQDLTNITSQSTLLQSTDSNVLDTISIISGFQPIPTPPLSPDHLDSTTSINLQSVALADGNIEDQTAEALLDEMLKCQQITSFDGTDSFTDSQGSFTSSPDPADILIDPDLLLNNCCTLMWNSHAYEPRSLMSGIYTPAPSPPPDAHIAEEPEIPAQLVENVIQDDKTEEPEESECISPCDIFPTYSVIGDKNTQLKGRTISTSVLCESSRHSRADSSESDEEIDVVTVSMPYIADRMSTRSRSKSKFSTSAPCSRQVSPIASSDKKKKMSTTKRITRINSVGSGVGEGTESDDEHRRASHNILERKRRNDLKYSFQVLREQVPELEDNQRAPKVTILRKAAEYIRRIQVEGDAMEQELVRERKREAKLRQRLAYLKGMPIAAR